MWWKQAEFLQAAQVHYRQQGPLQHLAPAAAQLHGVDACWRPLAMKPLIAWCLLPEQEPEFGQVFGPKLAQAQAQGLFRAPAMPQR